MNKEQMERLLSVTEAATYLGISVHTVRKMLASHQLGRTKIGRRTLIRESQLHRVIKDEFTSDEEQASVPPQQHPGGLAE